MALTTTLVLAGEALVVRSPARVAGKLPQMPFEFSWAFVLRPDSTGQRCRLAVRERYQPDDTAAAAMIAVAGVVSTVMTSGMLRGIRRRAEASTPLEDGAEE